ncbi:MAG: hypothetical protein ACI4F1_12270 [Bariatricus sp.]
MKYLCMKQITVGNKTFHPGEMIPDGVIFPERIGKLKSFGYISPVYDADTKNSESVSEGEKEKDTAMEKQEAKIKKSRKVSEEVKE